MSEQQQRIERWVNVYSDRADDWLEGSYSTQTAADRCAAADRVKAIRLVEIRDGEPHPDKVREITDELQVQAIDASNRLEKAERELNALTERAEKAEAALNELRESYLMESISVDLGARAQFERETAARLLAAEYGAQDDEISFENAIEVESYWQRRAMWAKRTASVLADACFGAKEAKG